MTDISSAAHSVTSGCDRAKSMTVVELAAIGLATWRLTSLISRESGPFDVFVRFRKLLGFKHDDGGAPVGWPDNVLAKMVSCPFCLSVWIAPAVYAMWRAEADVVLVIAAMAVAALVSSWTDR